MGFPMTYTIMRRNVDCVAAWGAVKPIFRQTRNEIACFGAQSAFWFHRKVTLELNRVTLGR